jgi:hypothetical protein
MTGLFAAILLAMPSMGQAQTEGAVGLARDVFAREVIKDSLPPPPAVIEERVVLPERVVRERTPLPARVVERPILEERVIAQPALRWWEVLTRSRYGYYDDAYFDDNWYYDYYESPAIAAASGAARYRTSWLYAPTAERGLFSW